MERKNLKFSLIAVLAVVMCAGLANAQPAGGDDDNGPKERQRERGERAERGERGERGERAERGERGERGEKGERGKRGQRGGQEVLKGLDLSDDQKEAIKGILKGKQEEGRAIREEMKEARESGDQEAMKAAMEKIQAMRDEMHEAVRGELNAEQQATFDENLAKLKEKAAERKGKGKGGAEGKNGKKGGEGGPEGKNGKKRGGNDGGEDKV
ncbi:Spy/CpxP family protein refolding chaperone [Algisphaera agarilytica]|uniref:Spy/CpxP family protein refolding chaperone n=1 Tax=Algisphaera agarilytica TaxID=1385975 RepID=A0A7X0H8C6_9BACT|nr:Spy/CpxP family protein refolding chaperone [Algisphaera agarilytica]MBB6431165.1 Spy/CpxP family protein refolding chaperone [Algisphaera agarilytica]